MKNYLFTLLSALALSIAMLSLSGCGKTGPLTLPDDNAQSASRIE